MGNFLEKIAEAANIFKSVNWRIFRLTEWNTLIYITPNVWASCAVRLNGCTKMLTSNNVNQRGTMMYVWNNPRYLVKIRKTLSTSQEACFIKKKCTNISF